MSDLQKAARYRASWIRTLRGIRINLIENAADRQTMVQIIDRQLASMGAETLSEQAVRRHEFYQNWAVRNPSDAEFKQLEQTAKPYKMTEADIKRYWGY